MDDPRKLGEYFRTKREAAGLSLRKVASQAGVSASYLSDLELGRRSWNHSVVGWASAAIETLSQSHPKKGGRK